MLSIGAWALIGVLVLYLIALTCWSIESTRTLREALIQVIWGLVLIALPIVVTFVLLLVLAPDALGPD